MTIGELLHASKGVKGFGMFICNTEEEGTQVVPATSAYMMGASEAPPGVNILGVIAHIRLAKELELGTLPVFRDEDGTILDCPFPNSHLAEMTNRFIDDISIVWPVRIDREGRAWMKHWYTFCIGLDIDWVQENSDGFTKWLGVNERIIKDNKYMCKYSKDQWK